jgi:sodium-coupled neutral amino acid transporter 11
MARPEKPVLKKSFPDDNSTPSTGILSPPSTENGEVAVHEVGADAYLEQPTPRTATRVRFQLDDEPDLSQLGPSNINYSQDTDEDAWTEEEDYLTSHAGAGRRDEFSHHAPLLTDLEAPSVTVANSDFNAEDHLETARPRSGLRMAFMNMANSIIGAGIIGQPYAFRQAGLLTGVVLLVVLTVVVDWTIRLIVINSKLSGANSFQSTMEYCFGRKGLIAISVAQWAL